MVAVLNGNGTAIVRFSIFEVDLKAGELRRNGSRVKLQEQPFQILATLLEHPGEVVTREELRTRLWPADTFVDFDHGLNAAVRRLRDALGDSAENPRFVETVARRGYRFLAPLNGAAPILAPATVAPRSSIRRWLLVGVAGVVLLIGTVVGWHAAQRNDPHHQITLRRLTANPAEDRVTSAALSPDGKYLAFSDQTGFYLRQVDSGETHALVLPAGFNARPESWFPDSTHLVVTSVLNPQEPPSLWQISIMGGAPQKLADRGRTASVSPDGSQIAFLKGPAFGETWVGPEGGEDVWVMQGDGEGQGRLIAADGSSFGRLAWSPNGKLLAYARGRYHTGSWTIDSQIEVMDLSSRKIDVIFAEARIGADLCWTSDGRLFFVRQEPSPNQNDWNLWYITVNPATGTRVHPAVRLTNTPGFSSGVSASADGKRLAFFKHLLQPDVYVADLQRAGTRMSQPRRLTLDEREDYPYAWTPDNRSVLFVSDRDGPYHLFKQSLDQPTPELLVGGEGEILVPRLGPDQTNVLYLTTPTNWTKSSSSVRLMRVPLAGGPPQLVLTHEGISNQQCARLPSKICIFSEASLPGTERFYSFDPMTGHTQELPKLKLEAQNPYGFNWTLSPDGRTMAFSEKLGIRKEPELRLVSVSDGSERRVKVQAWSGISSIDWAADGKSIWAVAFTARDTWTLLNVDLQGRVRPMLEEKEMRIGWAIPSNDGRHLALWEASGSSNVWMAENF
jgi:DNA-binding winged helix-turn-helix (wHTH) protein/Tol biopolymer transport system component